VNIIYIGVLSGFRSTFGHHGQVVGIVLTNLTEYNLLGASREFFLFVKTFRMLKIGRILL
jgi:hypothetical protein